VTDRERRREPPPDRVKDVFVQQNQTLWRADAVRFRAGSLPRQLALKLLVLDLNRRHRAYEVARGDPTSGTDHAGERRERGLRGMLAHVQLVEEPGGVNEIERSGIERRVEDVSGDEANRGGELRFRQFLPHFADALPVNVQSGQAARRSEALAQTFEPEKRGASGVEDVEAADVAKEVQLAVAEGDQVLFELRALLRRQGVPV